MTDTCQETNGCSTQEQACNQYKPQLDVFETPQEVVLLADMPGVRVEDLDINFENGELVIHGKVAARHADASFAREEYGIGDFRRVLSVSESIDASHISAELKNGVLTLRLPKSERVKPRRVEVKAG